MTDRQKANASDLQVTALPAALKAVHLLNSNDFTGAVKWFDIAMKANGDFAALAAGKALALIGLGKNAEAKMSLQEVLEKNADNWVIKQCNGTEVDKTQWTEYPQISPSLVEKQIGSALALIRGETVVKVSPIDQLDKIIALLKQNSYAAAKEKLNVLLEKESLRGVHYLLGLCHTGLADLYAARDAFTREIELFPDNEDARNFLKSIELDIGEVPAASGVTGSVETCTVGEHGSRPRFLQVHGFYDQYLGMFYQQRQKLAQAPYRQQLEALLEDGFSAPQLYSPYMSALGYDSDLVIANCPPLQAQWCIENSMRLDDPNNWRVEITRKQIEHFKPDVIFLGDCVNGLDATLLRGLSHQPKVVMGWRAATIPDGTDWTGFDAILSGLTALRGIVSKYGAKEGIDFYPGYPERFNEKLEGITPDFDITFCGQWTTKQHPQRNYFLTRVAEHAAEKGYSLGLFLSGEVDATPPIVRRYLQPPAFGIDMLKALKRGRITLDARGLVGTGDYHEIREDLAGKETTTMRMWEATGSGAFLLAQYHSNLSKYFIDGEEIVTFSDERELLEKIDFYVKNSEAREAIRRRGQQRCLTEHSMEMRAKAMDTLIRERMQCDKQSEQNVLRV